ncbi:MAG: protein phosphatase 2C domain-containing protein [Acidimicrobiia bacterium]
MSATAATTSCPSCAEPVSDGDRFCEGCGFPLAAVDSEAPATRADGRIEAEEAHAAGVSHRGKLHRRNEDAMHVASSEHTALAIVCDGVSSSMNPDLASRVAVSAAGNVLAARGDLDAESRMRHAIAAAQSAVLRVPWTAGQRYGAPACTLAAATWDGATVVVGNVGDSRVYWIDDAQAELLTADDSWLWEQVAAGVDPQVAEQDQNAHMITRWLGADAPDDVYRVATFVPPRSGRLVVCSDGLWNYATSADEMALVVRTLTTDGTALAVAHALVDRALDEGGHDNVTVVVIDIEPTGGPEPHVTPEESS